MICKSFKVEIAQYIDRMGEGDDYWVLSFLDDNGDVKCWESFQDFDGVLAKITAHAMES